MLFTKFFAVSTLSALAVATPVKQRTDGGSSGSCNTGPIQCCETVTTALDPVVGPVLKLLGIVIQDLNVPVALTCSPITILGGGNGGCAYYILFGTAMLILFVARIIATVASSPSAVSQLFSEIAMGWCRLETDAMRMSAVNEDLHTNVASEKRNLLSEGPFLDCPELNQYRATRARVEGKFWCQTFVSFGARDVEVVCICLL
ncbi:hypothetical protein V5O48_009670 [Marasmius crinis-equi]|uniref:Hydrophobin n=1 Tax=Marasmius crinis-equi TaxID=585013 RepID=A0ABR3FAG1_9AGAR